MCFILLGDGLVYVSHVANYGVPFLCFVLKHAQADVVPFFKEEMNHICGTVQHAR